MGRSAGLFTAHASGMRISSQLTFTPAFVRPDGKFVNQRVKIPVGINGFKNKKTGEAPASFFSLIAWGGRADFCCKNLTMGRAIDVELEPESYRSNYYVGNNILLDTNGQPILIDKVQFRVLRIVLAEEAYELVAEEVRTGRRPQNWEVPNHPDQALWKSMCQNRSNTPYDGGPTYGYARVFNPAQGTVILNPVEYKRRIQAQMGGAAFTPVQLPQQVQNAFTPSNVPAPVVNPAPINNMFGTGGFKPKAATNTVAANAGTRLPF